MTRAAASLAAVLALAAMQAHAINKCVDRHGKVSYQNAPCPESSRQEKVTVMPGPAAAPEPRAGAAAKAPEFGPTGLLPAGRDVADPRMDSIVSTLTTYEGCEAASPSFAKANAPKYQAWRGENTELLDRLPHSQRYMKLLRIERDRVQGQLADPAARKAFAASCDSRLGPVLGSASNSR